MTQMDKFIYLESSVSSTETHVNTRLAKAWAASDRLSIIWKSDVTDKVKRYFFQVVVVSILLYGSTTLMLRKRMEKNTRRQLHKNTTSNIEEVLEATSQKVVAVRLPITKTIQVRRTRHAGHYQRSGEETY